MKKALCLFAISIILFPIAAQASEQAEIVTFERSAFSTYTFFRQDIPLTLEEALELFSSCPQNIHEIQSYKFAHKAGTISSISGIALTAGTAVFWLGSTLAGKTGNYSDIQLYSALTGGIMFITGLICLQSAGARLKRAHANYNLYIMGFPAAAF